jgi:hypothetical protein
VPETAIRFCERQEPPPRGTRGMPLPMGEKFLKSSFSKNKKSGPRCLLERHGTRKRTLARTSISDFQPGSAQCSSSETAAEPPRFDDHAWISGHALVLEDRVGLIDDGKVAYLSPKAGEVGIPVPARDVLDNRRFSPRNAPQQFPGFCRRKRRSFLPVGKSGTPVASWCHVHVEDARAVQERLG